VSRTILTSPFLSTSQMHTTFSLQSVHLFFALYGSSFIVLQSLHVILYIFSFLRFIARFLARFFVADGRHFARSPNPMSAHTLIFLNVYVQTYTSKSQTAVCVKRYLATISSFKINECPNSVS